VHLRAVGRHIPPIWFPTRSSMAIFFGGMLLISGLRKARALAKFCGTASTMAGIFVILSKAFTVDGSLKPLQEREDMRRDNE